MNPHHPKFFMNLISSVAIPSTSLYWIILKQSPDIIVYTWYLYQYVSVKDKGYLKMQPQYNYHTKNITL